MMPKNPARSVVAATNFSLADMSKVNSQYAASTSGPSAKTISSVRSRYRIQSAYRGGLGRVKLSATAIVRLCVAEYGSELRPKLPSLDRDAHGKSCPALAFI